LLSGTEAHFLAALRDVTRGALVTRVEVESVFTDFAAIFIVVDTVVRECVAVVVFGVSSSCKAFVADFALVLGVGLNDLLAVERVW